MKQYILVVLLGLLLVGTVRTAPADKSVQDERQDAPEEPEKSQDKGTDTDENGNDVSDQKNADGSPNVSDEEAAERAEVKKNENPDDDVVEVKEKEMAEQEEEEKPKDEGTGEDAEATNEDGDTTTSEEEDSEDPYAETGTGSEDGTVEGETTYEGAKQDTIK